MSQKLTDTSRQPYIDVLRAIAIVIVITYHLKPDTFPGGSLGVDIFFVISGYLVTSIIWAAIQNDDFYLGTFYKRRIVKLVPPLIPILFFTFLMSWVVLPPSELYEISQSIIASLFFFGNVYFFRETEYFGAVKDGQFPILHLWSLGVEEQFYLVFPLLLIFLRSRRIKLYLTVATTLSFLGFSVLIWKQEYREAFFLLPFRAWELVLGALVFITATSLRDNALLRYKKLDVLCVAIIAISVTTYSPNQYYSSIFNLSVCLSTAILLVAANQGNLMKRLENIDSLTLTGQASYSIYLWHLPPLFFVYKWKAGAPIETPLLAIILLSSVLLGLTSWYLIETWARNWSFGRTLRIFILPPALVLILVAGLGLVTRGLETTYYANRLNVEEKWVYNLFRSSDNSPGEIQIMESPCRFNVTDLGSETVSKIKACHKIHGDALVVSGDSHAYNLFNIIVSSEVKNEFIIGFLRGGCRLGDHQTESTCHYIRLEEFLESYYSLVSKVVYHQSGSHLVLDKYGRGDTNRAFYPTEPYSLDREKVDVIKDRLSKFSGYVEVLWVGPFIEPRIDFLNKRNYKKSSLKISSSIFSRFAHLDSLIKETFLEENARGEYRVRYISLLDELGLVANSNIFTDRCIFYKDYDHFSQCGEVVMGKKLKEFFKRYL